MSQDSIGVVTTGTMKATGMEDNSETKPLPQIERHSYSEVGWISRQILSASGRGRTFFLTSLFIELIDHEGGPMPQISTQEFERLPLRVHDFLAGVPLHDVWAVDLPRTRSGITLDEFLRTASTRLFTC